MLPAPTLNSAMGLDGNIRATAKTLTGDRGMFAAVLSAYQAEFGQTPVQTCYRLAYALGALPGSDDDDRIGQIMGLIADVR